MASRHLRWAEPRIPEVVQMLNGSESGEAAINVLMSHLKLIELRTLQVARYRRFMDPRFRTMVFSGVGSGAREVLAALVGPSGTLADLHDLVVIG